MNSIYIVSYYPLDFPIYCDNFHFRFVVLKFFINLCRCLICRFDVGIFLEVQQSLDFIYFLNFTKVNMLLAY